MSTIWSTWERLEDLPHSIRTSASMAQIVGGISAEQMEALQQVVQEAAARALEDILWRKQITWAVQQIQGAHPTLPKRAVFKAVAILHGRSESYVRQVYYGEGTSEASDVA